MKRLNQILMVIALLTAMMAKAVEFSDGYLTFATGIGGTNWDGVYVTGLTAEGKAVNDLDLIIPGAVTYNGYHYRVVTIADNAFLNRTNIKRVSFRVGTIHIGTNAFKGCTNMTTLFLTSSIQDINSGAFSGCTSLAQVNYPGFDFPRGTVAADAFPSNSGMRLYISPMSTRFPDEYMSQTGWTQFATVEMHKTACDFLTNHAYYAYGTTDNAEASATRPLVLIGVSSNAGITNFQPLNTFTIDGMPFILTWIGNYAFEGETTIQTIDLSGCTHLNALNTYAFANCTSLTSLTLPKQNVEFSPDCFVSGCTHLTEILVPEESTSFSSHDGALYNYGKTTLLRVPEGKSSVSYPSTLLEVRRSAHANCKNLLNSYLPYGVRTIGFAAYEGTSSLRNVVIPSSVTHLDNARMFKDSNSSLKIYCNMDNPPKIPNASNFFGNNSSRELYVPYSKESIYQDSLWTGFTAVNKDRLQAYDFFHNISTTATLSYTVTSTAPATVNGTNYDGRIKLVSCAATNNNNLTSIEIPASITYNGKNYAVTQIGDDAFNNRTNNFTVSGCLNVDTVGNYAFHNQPITSYPFTHTLMHIGNHAFDGAGLTGTVAIPYGVRSIGSYAFANGKYSRLIVPNSIINIYGSFCNNTTTLNELIINKNSGAYYNYKGWALGLVPTTCYIRVPVGVVNQWKQNSALSSRADHITAGAYDFAMNNNYSGNYMMKVLSSNPVTNQGTTYDGTASYVYTPNVAGREFYGWLDAQTDKTVSNDQRTYLITEIGDSLLVGSSVKTINIPSAVTRIGDHAYYDISTLTTNNLELPLNLTYIGENAFSGTNLTGEIKIPESVTTVGLRAFNYMRALSSLYFMGAKPATLSDEAWTNDYSNSNLTVWVPNEYAYQYMNEASEWGNHWTDLLAVWFKPTSSTQMFSAVVPTDMASSGINAYYASAFNKTNPTEQLTLTKVSNGAKNMGMLLTDLVVNQEYRIARLTTSVGAPRNNFFVGTPSSEVNIVEDAISFYWDDSGDTPHFVKATSEHYSSYGSAYLKLNTTQGIGISHVYTNLWPMQQVQLRGDINGDDMVDVDDMNILINIILGKANANDFPGKADIDDSGVVDVDDMNIVINIILGKE